MEEDANDEGEADADPGVLQCVDPLEAQWLVDGDELVDRHADDDVNRTNHEHIDQRDHEVSLEKNGIRGGISSIMKRSASANNHYLHNFDETREQSYISYIDMNSLYPHAMKDALPYSDFRWESEQVDFMNIADNAERGYILEVDLAYPADLHHSHNQYPLAPDHFTPHETERSLYNDGQCCGNIRKLIPNLHDKEHYVLHYRNLKYYVQMGLIIKTVHCIVSFRQRA